jgi:hypothetical protein
VTGAFEIPSLAPGRYGLIAQVDDDLSLQAPAIGAQWAFAEIVIAEAGVDNVFLRMVVPPTIQGQIKVEGQAPPTFQMNRLSVSLTSSANALILPPSATPAADGSFLLNAVSNATARITVDGLPGEFYVREARLDGSDVLRTSAKFSAAGNLELTISSRAGWINGRVLDAKGKPVAGIEAVLVPNQSRERPELFKRSTIATDPQGRFFIFGIPPGDYKVFAWERIDPNSFFDEQVMQRYEQQGVPVHIGESARENVEVRIIPEAPGP